MGDKFTVIKGNADTVDTNRIMRTIAVHDCWERQYCNSVLRAFEKNKEKKIAEYPQDKLMKIALGGIKYIASIHEVRRENTRVGTGYVQTLEEAQTAFRLMDAVFTVCGHLTLRNFVTTFPIDKNFDGKKWGGKDYFYTMDVLSEMDWDKPIGRDKLSELLWDYDNPDLRNAYIEFTTAMSAIYPSQTGKGVDHGIGTYTMDRETGIMKDNRTGGIMKPKKAGRFQIVK